jgi:uncharacterized protein
VFIVDTNILLYALNSESPFSPRCKTFLDECIRQHVPWYLTWGTIYEFLRVATHPKAFKKPLDAAKAMGFLDSLFASPQLSTISEGSNHQEILRQLLSELPYASGNFLFDARTVAIMRENGIRTIYTRDTDFHRFKGIEVIDPVA